MEKNCTENTGAYKARHSQTQKQDIENIIGFSMKDNVSIHNPCFYANGARCGTHRAREHRRERSSHRETLPQSPSRFSFFWGFSLLRAHVLSLNLCLITNKSDRTLNSTLMKKKTLRQPAYSICVRTVRALAWHGWMARVSLSFIPYFPVNPSISFV